MQKNHITLFLAFIFIQASYAQIKWTVKKPFEQKNFIQNNGQFFVKDKLSSKQISHAASIDGVTYYFTKTGYVVQHLTKQKNTEREIEELKEKYGIKEKKGEKEEDEKEFKYKTVSQFHQMQWLGTNPNVLIVAEDMVSNYYTYKDEKDKQGKTTIKAQAYKKLTYKNLYPFIDVVYEFPADTTGIKYSIYLHPGADVNQIKINYPNNNGVELNQIGNIVIQSEFGLVTDHQPYTYQLNTKKVIKSNFILHKNTLSFFIDKTPTNQTIVIDPWTITPNLSFNNSPYDIQHDPSGNVYIYGGQTPYQLQKYTSAGSLIWTYNTAANGYYGDFTLDAAGNAYVIYGPFDENCTKISPSGTLVFSVVNPQPSSTLSEIYRIYPNPVNGQLTVLGVYITTSGVTMLQPMSINVDPNTGIFSAPSLHPTCIQGETRCMTVDANGDVFGLVFDAVNSTSQTGDNLLWKLNSSNVTTGSVVDGYLLNETDPSNTDSYYSGFNGMAIGCFLYTYDGQNLKQWDKTNLTLINSVAITGGSHYITAGLCTDKCGNVYVGGPTSILVFNANLVLLNSVTTPGRVYDVNNGNVPGEIIACGDHFAGSFSFPVTTCGSAALQVQSQTNNPICGNAFGSDTLIVTGGAPPYTITWNTTPVQTGSVVTNLSPGTYTASIIDNSCSALTGTVSITIAPPTSSLTVSFTSGKIKCKGDTTNLLVNVISGQSPYTYLWNTTATSNQIHGIIAGTYSVTVTDATTCSNTFSTTITQPTAITATLSSTNIKCNGDTASIQVNAAGGYSHYTYLWNTTSTTNSLHGVVANGYTVTITDSAMCTKVTSYTLTQPTPLTAIISKSDCQDENSAYIKVFASGGTVPYTYSWNTTPIQTSDSVTNLPPGNYSVTVADANLCAMSLSESIYLNFQNFETVNIFTPNGDTKNEVFFPFEYGNGSINVLAASIDSYELYIYDRWGKKVFYSTQPTNTWDGKEPSGSISPDGVYYWMLTINSKCQNIHTQNFKGFVHLSR